MREFNSTPPPPPLSPGSNPPGPNYNQSPKYYGQNGVNRPAKPDNYLLMSIIATILGLCSCLPFILGIIAIIFATQVDSKYNRGDYPGAQGASKTAQVLAIISLVLAIMGLLGNIFYYIIVGSALFAGL